MSKDPLDVAVSLANVYGHRLDTPVVYTQGVALSGRLRLARLRESYPGPARELEGLTAGLLESDDPFAPESGTANLAAIVWADELTAAGGNKRYAELLVRTADRFKATAPSGMSALLDPDFRVEDMFFASALLGLATGITGDSSYADIDASFLLEASEKLLQENGLYWHSLKSPFFWGRGNGFAALGFAELLTYLPAEHKAHPALVAAFDLHLDGLSAFQDDSGMWRQVVDRPDSYLEMSATCMIGYSMARALRSGWIGTDRRAAVENAWRGAAERIQDDGALEKVCVGTGPLASVEEYVERPFVTGLDDRGGAMALWFAVEMARLRAAT